MARTMKVYEIFVAGHAAGVFIGYKRPKVRISIKKPSKPSKLRRVRRK